MTLESKDTAKKKLHIIHVVRPLYRRTPVAQQIAFFSASRINATFSVNETCLVANIHKILINGRIGRLYSWITFVARKRILFHHLIIQLSNSTQKPPVYGLLGLLKNKVNHNYINARERGVLDLLLHTHQSRMSIVFALCFRAFIYIYQCVASRGSHRAAFQWFIRSSSSFALPLPPSVSFSNRVGFQGVEAYKVTRTLNRAKLELAARSRKNIARIPTRSASVRSHSLAFRRV